jgi:hypothetical protein
MSDERTPLDLMQSAVAREQEIFATVAEVDGLANPLVERFKEEMARRGVVSDAIIGDRLANDLDAFADGVAARADRFAHAGTRYIDVIRDILPLMVRDLPALGVDRDEMIRRVHTQRDGILKSYGQLEGFANAVRKLPTLSPRFGESKARVVNEVEEYLKALTYLSGLIQRVEADLP